MILFIIIMIIAISSCTRDKTDKIELNETFTLESEPDQLCSYVDVLFYDSSKIKAHLKAKRAQVYQEKMETLFDGGLEVDFFSYYTGRRNSRLTADSARIDDRTKNMVARGHVVVISDSSYTKLETQLLHWDNKSQKFYSNEFVKITSPTEYIQGYGLESDANLTNYKILKVSGEQK